MAPTITEETVPILERWRTRILNGYLLVLAAVSIPAYALTVVNAISQPDLRPFVPAFTILEVLLLAIALVRWIDYRLRVLGLLLIGYTAAVVNLAQFLRLAGRCDLLATGPIMGLVDEIEYVPAWIDLCPGEGLFIYSDGVEDTQNPAGEFFGRERLLELAAAPAHSAGELVERFKADLAAYREQAHPYDDVTMLAVVRAA